MAIGKSCLYKKAFSPCQSSSKTNSSLSQFFGTVEVALGFCLVRSLDTSIWFEVEKAI